MELVAEMTDAAVRTFIVSPRLSRERVSRRGNGESKSGNISAITILGETGADKRDSRVAAIDRNCSFRRFDFLRAAEAAVSRERKIRPFSLMPDNTGTSVGNEMGFDCDLVVISYYLVILQALNL